MGIQDNSKDICETKPIDIRYHHVAELVSTELMKLLRTATEAKRDILTKLFTLKLFKMQ